MQPIHHEKKSEYEKIPKKNDKPSKSGMLMDRNSSIIVVKEVFMAAIDSCVCLQIRRKEWHVLSFEKTPTIHG
jgi:hypothetical protein